jgi:hypothetical protein
MLKKTFSARGRCNLRIKVMGTKDSIRSVVTWTVLFAMILALIMRRGIHVTALGLKKSEASQYMLKGRHCRKRKSVWVNSVRTSRAIMLYKKIRHGRLWLRRSRRSTTESLTSVMDEYQIICEMKTRKRMVRRFGGETDLERRPKP